MYYITAAGSNGSKPVGITTQNVFCACPKCGRPVYVNLEEFIEEKGFSLTHTSVLCRECTRKVLRSERIYHILQIRTLN